MIYRFVMLSEENDFFRREIEIDSEATFQDLNDFILDSLSYSRQEFSTFFVCDEDWQKEQEIKLLDMRLRSDEDIFLMSSTRLEDFIESKGDRLLFVFDMLSERAFFIELMEVIYGESLTAPRLTLSEGKAPKQTSSVEFAAQRGDGAVASGKDAFDLDDDMFGGEGVDFEDLESLTNLEEDELGGYL